MYPFVCQQSEGTTSSRQPQGAYAGALFRCRTAGSHRRAGAFPRGHPFAAMGSIREGHGARDGVVECGGRGRFCGEMRFAVGWVVLISGDGCASRPRARMPEKVRKKELQRRLHISRRKMQRKRLDDVSHASEKRQLWIWAHVN